MIYPLDDSVGPGYIHLSIIQNDFIGADLDKSEAVLVESITHWKIIESP